jgi:hypothetical protein
MAPEVSCWASGQMQCCAQRGDGEEKRVKEAL